MPEGEYHYDPTDHLIGMQGDPATETRGWQQMVDTQAAAGDAVDEQAVLADVRGYGGDAAHPKTSANPGDVERMVLEEGAGDVPPTA